YPTSPFLFERSTTQILEVNGTHISVPAFTTPLGELDIEPFSPVGVDVFTFPQGRVNNTYQFADTMSYTYLSHSMKFGFDIRRNQLNGFQDRNYRPLLIFGNG